MKYFTQFFRFLLMSCAPSYLLSSQAVELSGPIQESLFSMPQRPSILTMHLGYFTKESDIESSPLSDKDKEQSKASGNFRRSNVGLADERLTLTSYVVDRRSEISSYLIDQSFNIGDLNWPISSAILVSLLNSRGVNLAGYDFSVFKLDLLIAQADGMIQKLESFARQAREMQSRLISESVVQSLKEGNH